MRKLGQVGCITEDNRKAACLVSSSLILSSIVLMIFSVISYNANTVETMPWSISTNDQVTAKGAHGKFSMWIGLGGVKQEIEMVCLEKGGCEFSDSCSPGVGVETRNATTGHVQCRLAQHERISYSKTQRFKHDTCEHDGITRDASHDYCKHCKDSCTSSFVAVIGTLIFLPGCWYVDYTRSKAETDTNCDKFQGAVGNILGGLLTLASISSFGRFCDENLPDVVQYQGATFHLDYNLGWCYIALIVACCLFALGGCVHLLIKTPPGCWEPLGPTDETTELNEPTSDYNATDVPINDENVTSATV